MFAFLKKPGFMLFAGAALLAVVAFGGACGDDDDDADAADGVSLEQFQKTAVLVALTAIKVEDLHGIDEGSQTASEIEAGWSGSIGRAHGAVVGTDWPDELQDLADATETALATAAADLEAEDLESFKGHATEAHDAYHDLDHDARAFVAGEAHEEGEEHGDEATDAAADESPEASDEH